MTFKSVMFDLVADCPKCGTAIPLPGIIEYLQCKKCATRCPTPPTFWRRVLGDVVAEALGFPEGKGRTGLVRSTPVVKIVFGRMVPKCGQCKEALPARGLADAATEGATHMYCPFCGHANGVRTVPEWFQGVHPAAVALVNEAIDPSRNDKDLAFHCFSCGSLVPADPSGAPTRCEVCGERVSIPGGILRKLSRRSNERSPFFVLADMGEAIGVVPQEARHVSDFGIEPYGRLVLAWHPAERRRLDLKPRLSLIDHRGLVVWEKDELAFSDGAQIHACPVSGNIIVVDPAGALWHVDPKDGTVLWTMPPAGGSPSRLDVTDMLGFQVDADGSLVVHRDWGNGEPRLRRFSPEGARVPMWSGATVEREETEAANAPPPSWDALQHRVHTLPPGSFYVAGWDGNTYIVDRVTAAIAKYGRDGACQGVMRPDPKVFRNVKSMGVDSEGTMVLLFTHPVAINGVAADHLARLLPTGEPRLWIGPHAEPSRQETPPDLGRLKLMPDGTVFLGGKLEQLRILSADGTLIWQSGGAARQGKRLLAGVARA